MGRTRNPDYFKVGGGTAGSGSSAEGRFGADRARLAAEQANLKRRSKKAAPVTRRPAPAAKPVAPEPGPVSPPRVIAPSAEAAAPAVVRDVHEAHPTHGKKRRSVKKRHDVAVERTRAEEYGSATGEQPEQARASVTDLHRARAAREPPAGRGPTTLPPTVRGLVRRVLVVAKDAVELVWEIVAAPVTVARLLSRMRERES